jgi:hypothetical protein
MIWSISTVPLCRVKRKLYFGRKPPTPREAVADSSCRKKEVHLQLYIIFRIMDPIRTLTILQSKFNWQIIRSI